MCRNPNRRVYCLKSRFTKYLLFLSIVPIGGMADMLDDVEFRHGIAFFQELKYPAGFTHLEYQNPGAPKGGTLVLFTQTNFETLAPAPENTSELRAPGGYASYPFG